MSPILSLGLIISSEKPSRVDTLSLNLEQRMYGHTLL